MLSHLCFYFELIIPIIQLPSHLPCLSHELAAVLTNFIVEKTAEMILDHQVIGFGHVSGPNVGIFSAIKSNIKLPENGQESEEQVVAAIKGVTRNGNFQGPGDSGAWVVDATGAMVGLLFGGPKGKDHEGSGYVTPIAAILADIKARTGYEASLVSPE